MEIKVGATDDGDLNSSPPLLTTSSRSLLPNQLLNVGTLTNFRQRNDIMVGGNFDVSIDGLIAREIEKRKIKEELLTYGHLNRRRELEQEAINELEKELSQRHPGGVSVINSHLLSLQQNELSLMNRLNGRISARLLLGNHLDSGIDRRIPLANQVDNVISGVLPYGNCLDGLIDGRMSLGNRLDGNADGLPFQRQPGVASGVACKPIIDLRKAVPPPKTATNDTLAGSKRKFETSIGDDVAVVVSKTQKTELGWSCDLCKVRATSEQALKDHLKGKKHKAKEKNVQKSTVTAINQPNKSKTLTDESSKVVVRSGSKSTTSPINIVCGDEGVKNVDSPSNEKLPVESPNDGPGLEEDRENEEFQNVDTDFKFWCKMCEVGATDEASMTAHRKGEMHLRLLNEKGGGVIAIKTLPGDVKSVDFSRNDIAVTEKEGH